MGGKQRLAVLQRDIADCRICASELPLGPRPVVQFSRHSQIVVVGQAPGTKVHESGVPWDDASGDHLREWLGVSRETFYDADRIALVPMGFCYPGRAAGGDAPPRPECAPAWHESILGVIGGDALLLLCGQYAQKYYLGARRRASLGATVRAFADYLPAALPLPHPSWRSRIWREKNSWFDAELLPVLRAEVAARVG